MAPTRLGTGQAALYAAEEASLQGLGIRWRRVADAQEYADRLVGSDWFARRFPHFVGCAVERRGAGSVWSTNQPFDDDGPAGRPTEGAVLLADGALRQRVLLHELAHLLAPPGSGHGAPFADTLLELVRQEMGFYAFVAFRSALRGHPGFSDVGGA